MTIPQAKAAAYKLYSELYEVSPFCQVSLQRVKFARKPSGSLFQSSLKVMCHFTNNSVVGVSLVSEDRLKVDQQDVPELKNQFFRGEAVQLDYSKVHAYEAPVAAYYAPLSYM